MTELEAHIGRDEDAAPGTVAGTGAVEIAGETVDTQRAHGAPVAAQLNADTVSPSALHRGAFSVSPIVTVRHMLAQIYRDRGFADTEVHLHLDQYDQRFTEMVVSDRQTIVAALREIRSRIHQTGAPAPEAGVPQHETILRAGIVWRVLLTLEGKLTYQQALDEGRKYEQHRAAAVSEKAPS